MYSYRWRGLPVAAPAAGVEVVSAARGERRDHAGDGPRQPARRRRPVEAEHLLHLWAQFKVLAGWIVMNSCP